MILQLIIRKPDQELSEAILVGCRQSEQVCIESIKLLLDDKITPAIAKLCFSFFPEGFVIEGVAYGEVEEEPIDAYDLDLKVLH
jgi:hypothetical protein